jgi:hypothetical protein
MGRPVNLNSNQNTLASTAAAAAETSKCLHVFGMLLLCRYECCFESLVLRQLNQAPWHHTGNVNR